MEKEEFIKIEEDENYIRVSGQFIIDTIKGSEIDFPLGIAKEDTEENGRIDVEF